MDNVNNPNLFHKTKVRGHYKTKKKPNKTCEFCHKEFKEKGNLTTHLRIHVRDKSTTLI
jgi:hypothetical protein